MKRPIRLLLPAVALAVMGQMPMHPLPLGAGASGPCVPPTTWNPSDKDSLVALSNGDLTATVSSGSAWSMVRGTTSQTTGKKYFEVTVTTPTAPSTNFSDVGLADATQALNTFVGSSTHSFGCTSGTPINGEPFYNGSSTGAACYQTFSTPGNIIRIAVDLSGNLWWSRATSDTQWNDDPSADPATGVNGLALHIAGGTAVFPAFSGDSVSASVVATLNTDGVCTAFAGTVPSGFAAWN